MRHLSEMIERIALTHKPATLLAPGKTTLVTMRPPSTDVNFLTLECKTSRLTSEAEFVPRGHHPALVAHIVASDFAQLDLERPTGG